MTKTEFMKRLKDLNLTMTVYTSPGQEIVKKISDDYFTLTVGDITKYSFTYDNLYLIAKLKSKIAKLTQKLEAYDE